MKRIVFPTFKSKIAHLAPGRERLMAVLEFWVRSRTNPCFQSFNNAQTVWCVKQDGCRLPGGHPDPILELPGFPQQPPSKSMDGTVVGT